MNILILNWRDPKNPLSGGAEGILLRYGSYWVSKGHNVTWVCNHFKGLSTKETLDGITIIRLGPAIRGNLLSYLLFYIPYMLRVAFFTHGFSKKSKVDLLVDNIHGFPNFSPLYSSARRTVLLSCEVAGPIWYKMFPFPISFIGEKLEKMFYSLYEKDEIWAISNNTKNDILSFNPDLHVNILKLGVTVNESLTRLQKLEKNTFPSAVFLARLVKMKGIETAITATKKISKQYPDFQLFVIGSGVPEYVKHLHTTVQRLGVSSNVKFLGYLEAKEKYENLAKAHFLIHPSYKEGFGLTVLEAGLVGTPAIVRGGSSLDELVTDREDGYIFANDDQIPDMFISAYSDIKSYSKMRKHAIAKSLNYNWRDLLNKSEAVTGV